MKKTKYILVSLLTFMIFSNQEGGCQFVTRTEASTVAKNWIRMVIDKYGTWGKNDSAIAGNAEDLNFKDRLIGYVCPVEPNGYVIISLRKELTPVKAYSESCTDYSEVVGNEPDLVKMKMFKIIDTIESRFGSINAVNPGDLIKLTYQDYRKQWEFILNYTQGTLNKNMRVSSKNGAYVEGAMLLETNWHQNDPFNDYCPDLGCAADSGHALAGCGAIALAQVMRHWCWPPYGVASYSSNYSWAFMPNEPGPLSPGYIQGAVAELCSDAGTAQGMDYSCVKSTSNLEGIQDAVEDIFRFDPDTDIAYRYFHTQETWFDWIKDDINMNCPILYRVEDHLIVADGWRELIPGDKEYHMNYGWNNECTKWYILDELYLGGLFEEMMLRYIIPDAAVSPLLTYPNYPKKSFPFRYFISDTFNFGVDVTFESGQFIQMLPGVRVIGWGANYLKFLGNNSDYTYLYLNGNTSRGIRIGSGAVRLTHMGNIKINEQTDY